MRKCGNIEMLKVKVMKKKYPRGMNHLVLITGSQLLEQIHVPKLQRIVFGEIIVKAEE